MMTVEYNSKMSVGWFCLHDGLQKNEHEKTLLYYRLIMHSYSDIAFIKQVKGELYYFFNEIEKAIQHFEEAFRLYMIEGNIFYAFLLVLKMQSFSIKINNEQKEMYEKLKTDQRYYLFFD